MQDWQKNLITQEAERMLLLRQIKRVAVLGIKTEAQSNAPAFYVPKYLSENGIEIVPVPVYYLEVKTILDRPVFRRLDEIPGSVDLVNVFRRPKDIAAHYEDILSKKPRAVWLQLGIREDTIAIALAKEGIQVVQDRCLLVDYRSFLQQS